MRQAKKAEKKKKEEEEGEDKDKKEEVKDKPLNNTSPLYLKDPKECTDEEYKDFYRDTFMDYN